MAYHIDGAIPPLGKDWGDLWMHPINGCTYKYMQNRGWVLSNVNGPKHQSGPVPTPVFETGKKYKGDATDVWTCIFSGIGWAILAEPWPGGREMPVQQNKRLSFTEYVPPRAITGFVNVFEVDGKLMFGEVHTTQISADTHGMEFLKHLGVTGKLIDQIPVAYTEKE